MNNARIADVLDEIADILEFQAANPFRVRAYRNGARAVREWPQPLAPLADDCKRLTEISGIGKDLADKIRTLCQTGCLPYLEQLQAEVPASVLWYHATYVSPSWGKRLTRETQIGLHIFYS